MADLGLDALTDDQLLDLLGQACMELSARDPMVRNLAQVTIDTEAEKLKIKQEAEKTKLFSKKEAIETFKSAAEGALKKARREYENQILTEIAVEVRKMVSAGEITLLTADQEAAVAVKAEIQARITLIDEAINQLKSTGYPSGDRFAFEFTRNYIAFTHGGNNFQMSHKINPKVLDQIGASLKQLLEFADG